MEFQLRPWRESDIQNVYKYANNPKIACNLRDVFPYPYTLKDAQDFVAACLHADLATQCSLAISLKEEAIGNIGLFLKEDVYQKSAELGYWLAEPFWSKGIMSQAVRQICAIGFTHYDIVRIFAEPFSHNTASRRVLEKAGFELEGVFKNSVYKNGSLFDSCMYARLK